MSNQYVTYDFCAKIQGTGSRSELTVIVSLIRSN